MIPYDDLAAALAAWRARQGLAAATPDSGSGHPRAASPGLAPRPITAPVVPPRSATAPVVPPRPATAPVVPPRPATAPPRPAPQAELIEDAHYDPDGGDFSVALGASVESTDESTSIGGMPDASAPKRSGW